MAVTSNYEPYEPNPQGFTEALLDFKSTFVGNIPFKVTGYVTTAFENVSNGDALYMRTSDGQVGKASAADGTVENAQVVGFADADASANSTVKVIVIGLKTLSGLDAGDLYFLSPSTAGAITLTPPSSAGQAVVRVGEASTTTKFAIRVEPPIKLS